MKRYIKSAQDILCMSNVRGKYIVVDDVPFSFYYSVKNSNHGPRVKVTMNASNMRPNRMSSLKLCDDWSIEINSADDRISSKDLNEMTTFFRKYLILFLIVWEDLVAEPNLGDFMEGKMNLHEFIESTDFYKDYKEELGKITSVAELEDFCRANKLVNFYGN